MGDGEIAGTVRTQRGDSVIRLEAKAVVHNLRDLELGEARETQQAGGQGDPAHRNQNALRLWRGQCGRLFVCLFARLF